METWEENTENGEKRTETACLKTGIADIRSKQADKKGGKGIASMTLTPQYRLLWHESTEKANNRNVIGRKTKKKIVLSVYVIII